jgi:hypothetical protein
MYRIIISDDKKTIKYTFDGVEHTISVDSIRQSPQWKDSGVISFALPNPYDSSLVDRITLTKKAFTSRFLHNEYDTIEKDPFHEYDKDIFKLYCLLEGKEIDVDAAAGNLLAQRKLVDDTMRAWKNDKVVREVDATVIARNSMAAVSDKVSVLEDIVNADLIIEEGQEQIVELLSNAREELNAEIQVLQSDISKNIDEAKKASEEKKPFLQSTEMAKAIALAFDDSVPSVKLENVKLEDIDSEVLKVKESLEKRRVLKETE